MTKKSEATRPLNFVKKAGKNVWVSELGTMQKSVDRPGNRWYPAVPAYRVQGDTYQPYQGSSQWVRMANASMAEDANYNFRRDNNC